MKLNGRFDTILGSTYWENGKIVSRHANELPPEYELKLSEQARQALKDIDELADLIIFHAIQILRLEKTLRGLWEKLQRKNFHHLIQK